MHGVMTHLLWCNTRVVLLPGTWLLLLVLLTGCKAPSNGHAENANPAQGGPPMTARSPNTSIASGPITYLALGDSTGSGVGATEGGYVARLFKRLVAHRPGSKLTNLCFSGATTSDVLRTQLDRGVRSDPDRKSTRLNSSHSQISYAVF